jgi:hypothetical protein
MVQFGKWSRPILMYHSDIYMVEKSIKTMGIPMQVWKRGISRELTVTPPDGPVFDIIVE